MMARSMLPQIGPSEGATTDGSDCMGWNVSFTWTRLPSSATRACNQSDMEKQILKHMQ
jgi:hypothetical protein